MKRQVEYFDLQPTWKISKFTCISSACQPAVRPGCARCTAPETSHNKGNCAGFTKMLFRRRFTHAPWRFLLSFIPFLVLPYSFSKVTISLLRLLLITSRKTWLARDIISKWRERCFRVFVSRASRELKTSVNFCNKIRIRMLKLHN